MVYAPEPFLANSVCGVSSGSSHSFPSITNTVPAAIAVGSARVLRGPSPLRSGLATPACVRLLWAESISNTVTRAVHSFCAPNCAQNVYDEILPPVATFCVNQSYRRAVICRRDDSLHNPWTAKHIRPKAETPAVFAQNSSVIASLTWHRFLPAWPLVGHSAVSTRMCHYQYSPSQLGACKSEEAT